MNIYVKKCVLDKAVSLLIYYYIIMWRSATTQPITPPSSSYLVRYVVANTEEVYSNHSQSVGHTSLVGQDGTASVLSGHSQKHQTFSVFYLIEFEIAPEYVRLHIHQK